MSDSSSFKGAKAAKQTMLAGAGPAPVKRVPVKKTVSSSDTVDMYASPKGKSDDRFSASTEAQTTLDRSSMPSVPAAVPRSSSPGAPVDSTRTPLTVLPRASIENGEVQWVHTSRARLEVLRQIGEGGAGEVMVAMDHDIGRKVAIKKIRQEAMSPNMVLRFIEEIRTVGRLEHPNIIPIHDVGVDESGDYYFVMKFVEGQTLADIIEKLRQGNAAAQRMYPHERRVEIFRGLLEAVRYAHSKHVLHRDIKPENVMVGPFGEVLLMDWGIARNMDDEADSDDDFQEGLIVQGEDGQESADRFWRTGEGGIIGTPAYMSPEQAKGQTADERSDTYALCVLLYELLTLKHYLFIDDDTPIEEVLRAVGERTPTMMSFSMNIPGGGPPVPMDLVWYVLKGMNKNIDERYQSANDMVERLDKRAEGVIPIQCHITLLKRLNGAFFRFTDKHPMLSTMAMMGTMGLVATGIALVIIH